MASQNCKTEQAEVTALINAFSLPCHLSSRPDRKDCLNTGTVCPIGTQGTIGPIGQFPHKHLNRSTP